MEFKEISKEVIFDKKEITVKIKFYWDSHGKLVEFKGFNDKYSFSKKVADVKIEKVTRTIDNLPKEFTHHRLYIDNELKNGDIYGVSFNPDTNIINIKLCVGWGWQPI